jgi:hypothetical protein
VRGWASMLVAMLMFSAVQLFALAVVGEYLGRMFTQMKQRPLFIIREIVSVKTDKQAFRQVRELAHDI